MIDKNKLIESMAFAYCRATGINPNNVTYYTKGALGKVEEEHEIEEVKEGMEAALLAFCKELPEIESIPHHENNSEELYNQLLEMGASDVN